MWDEFAPKKSRKKAHKSEKFTTEFRKNKALKFENLNKDWSKKTISFYLNISKPSFICYIQGNLAEAVERNTGCIELALPG